MMGHLYCCFAQLVIGQGPPQEESDLGYYSLFRFPWGPYFKNSMTLAQQVGK